MDLLKVLNMNDRQSLSCNIGFSFLFDVSVGLMLSFHIIVKHFVYRMH